MNFADRVVDRTLALAAPIVAGMDPRPELLPRSLAPGPDDPPARFAAAYVEFAEQVFDGLADRVPAVKIQIAFYEALGAAGFAAYERTVALARERGLLVIGDIKRGDIGTTSEAYAEAHLGGRSHRAGVGADAVTLNPYLGGDALAPFFQRAATQGRGAFVLVRTSNPGAKDLQDLRCDGLPLYRHTARLVESWGVEHTGSRGYSSIGAVVGATYPKELLEIRAAHPRLLILVPGYGAQGGTAADVAAALDADGAGLLVASSRGILRAAKDAGTAGRPAAAAIRGAVETMRDEIRAAFDAVRRKRPEAPRT